MLESRLARSSGITQERIAGLEVEMPKSAWTEKDQIDNFLKEEGVNRLTMKCLTAELNHEETKTSERHLTISDSRLWNPVSNIKQAHGSEIVTHWFTLIVLSALRRSAGNPVKEILLKLELPDHRSILRIFEVEFGRISLTGFRSCASRSQTGASQSRQSTDSLQQSVVSLSYPSTNKAFQVLEDSPCLKPFLYGKHEFLASVDIFPCPKPCVQTQIHHVDLELLDPIVQCLINLLQSAGTELVDLIEPYDHLNPIFIPKCDDPWRVNYCKVVLELKASDILSRFGEV
ncbi:hypothetical protein Tco_0404909 [Tanacetum coccineum]